MNMKNNSINADLIEKFRNVVNSNLDFVFQKYKNKNGKNYWNLICSCMDWITVAIIHLQNNSFSKKDINVMTMQVFSYISSIDIVYESIKQLHRAIKGNTILPFHESKYIFSKNNIYKDDNEYFKQIRAAFGAHPVNLNDINGKWFASWPNHAIFDKGYDFELQLYSLDINKEDVIFGLKFAELDSFLLERYSYLLILIDEINKQFEEYKNALRKEIIEDNEDTLKLLQILKMESEKRLNNDYY